MTTEKKRTTLKLILITALVTALVTVCAVGSYFARLSVPTAAAPAVELPEEPKPLPAPRISSALVTESLQSLHELTTVKYLYTNVGRYTAANSFYGYTIPFTTKSFLLTYDGFLTASVDLSKVTALLEENTLTLSLPPAAITAHQIDETSMQVFDEKNSIFNPIQLTDYAAFFADEKQKLEEKAIANGLLEEATAGARETLTNFFSSGIFGEEKVKLVFTDAQAAQKAPSPPAPAASTASAASAVQAGHTTGTKGGQSGCLSSF